ncbi:MAG: CehA/McbA family metallohydrolase [Planctomycetes bacterium]|nr:CehA/McbA family metallohydrolase [Planctomycetota bacterium]
MNLKHIQRVILFFILVLISHANTTESRPASGAVNAIDDPARQTVRAAVMDALTGQPIPARVYIKNDRGGWHHVRSTAARGSAVRYEKRNWVNPQSEEFHTTVSAHPFETELEPGRYQLTVERGKEYVPHTSTFTVGEASVSLKVPLTRWINMAKRGWFSGDTHVHRTLSELPNVMLAEDLNVAFPLTYWVTHAFQPPTTGDKSFQGEVPDHLIKVDNTHVIWPRNTEWEIFSVGSRAHTLGAVFALGHKTPFELGVPPVKSVAAEARRQGALLDLDKHDWPWTMTLPPHMGVDLYELANNHIWRTEFAFTQWSSPTPAYLRPPLQERSGNEREWIQFTLANYYALLNCRLNMVPTAGTASGVHPVPLGFGRVYVNLPDGFSYDGWKTGLAAGRSFVTTGPMVFATVNGQSPGQRFTPAGQGFTARVQGDIISEFPLTFAEIIHNGQPVYTIMGRNERTATGGYRTAFSTELAVPGSGWLAVRCWEDRAGGRVRYAHTAPWHVEIAGKPLKPRAEERDYLVQRVQNELARSRDLLPPEAIQEYQAALAYYQGLPVRDEAGHTAHRDQTVTSDWIGTTGRVCIEPYSGERHPRIGFLEGALKPQRDTKVTVFTPWDPASYVVVDVPEAIWSNLGLTYLAHTHIDTIWDRQGVTLPPLEWTRHEDRSLTSERTLPNGIAFGARVRAHETHVEMALWLRNGTDRTLTDLRIQNCVMLKGAVGFNMQSNWNKRLQNPFGAVCSEDGQKWIITAWENCQRTWANPPVPCVHSDPQFEDLGPGQTGRLRGWLWFHEGSDITRKLAELQEDF